MCPIPSLYEFSWLALTCASPLPELMCRYQLLLVLLHFTQHLMEGIAQHILFRECLVDALILYY